MGKIQENLVLTDEFTAAFTRFLTLGESAVGATERINNSINMMGQSSNTIAAAGFNTLDQKITELSRKNPGTGSCPSGIGDAANSISGKGFDQMTAAIKEGNSALIDTIENQSRLGRETQKTNNQAGKLLSTIKRIAAAAGVTTLVRSFLDFSDTQAQINARLNLMNDGFQTTNELSEMIYQSALRSKAAYSDTADAVGKMGLNARKCILFEPGADRIHGAGE